VLRLFSCVRGGGCSCAGELVFFWFCWGFVMGGVGIYWYLEGFLGLSLRFSRWVLLGLASGGYFYVILYEGVGFPRAF